MCNKIPCTVSLPTNVCVAGFGMEAVFLLGVAFSQSTTVALTCLTMAVGVSGFAISGTTLTLLQLSRCNQIQRNKDPRAYYHILDN